MQRVYQTRHIPEQEASECSETDEEDVAMIQWLLKEHKTSPARHAWKRLPPPGNGKVGFSTKITMREGRQETQWVDHTIGNEFVEGFCQEEGGTDNPFLSEMRGSLKKEETKQKNEVMSEKEEGEENRGVGGGQEGAEGSVLPMRLEECLGDRFEWRRKEEEGSKNEGEGVDFTDIINAHGWFTAHQVMTNYEVEGPWWKECSKQWLHLEPGIPDSHGEWHIFVDGSKQGKATGSGGVIFLYQGGSWTFGGWMGLKSEGIDNFQTEVQAMALAAKWVLDNLKHRPIGDYKDLKVVFHFDNEAAGWGALGRYGSKRNLPEVKIVRSILQAIRTGYGIEPEGRHHKSHEGDIGNEMADDVARYCAKRGQPDDEFWRMVFNESTAKAAEWFWMLYRQDLQEKCEGKRLKIPKPQAEYDRRVVDDALPRRDKKGKEIKVEWDLKMATYNPMSLKGKGLKEARDFSLQESTLKQLDEIGAHVVAIQETRLKKKKKKAFNPHYHLVTSEADEKGVGGVCIALAKNRSIGQKQGRPVYIQEEDWRLIYADRDLLIIRVQTKLWDVTIVNAHCPHSGYEEEEIHKWWDKYEEILRAGNSGGMMIFLGDINGKIGQIESKAVGGNRKDPETTNGTRFHEMMLMKGLWCPTTFTEHHQGPTTTWISPQGQESRIDFIAIPEEWKDLQVRSQGLPQIVTRDFTHDHMAVMVEVKGNTTAHEDIPTKRYTPKRKIFEEKEAEDLRRGFRKVPKIAWDIDVHKHALQLHTSIKEKIEEEFKDRRKYVYKSFIQDDTWEKIQGKQSLRKEFFRIGGELRRKDLKRWFKAWAKGRRRK